MLTIIFTTDLILCFSKYLLFNMIYAYDLSCRNHYFIHLVAENEVPSGEYNDHNILLGQTFRVTLKQNTNGNTIGIQQILKKHFICDDPISTSRFHSGIKV